MTLRSEVNNDLVSLRCAARNDICRSQRSHSPAQTTPGIAIGDSQNLVLLRAVRAHANFAEYVPLALLLFAACEQRAASRFFLHALGISLLLGRLFHAYGVSKEEEVFAYRVSGMALTFTCYVAAAGYIFFKGVFDSV